MLKTQRLSFEIFRLKPVLAIRSAVLHVLSDFRFQRTTVATLGSPFPRPHGPTAPISSEYEYRTKDTLIINMATFFLYYVCLY